MEMKIDSYIKEQFGIENVDIRTYSPLALAYIGDGIFDLVIRSLIVGKGNTKASQLHYQTSHIVKAETQAKIIEALENAFGEIGRGSLASIIDDTAQNMVDDNILDYLYNLDEAKYGSFLEDFDEEVALV